MEMINKMMPPAIDNEPVEKCRSLARNSPRMTRISPTVPAVASILRMTLAFVALSMSFVVST